MEQIILKCIQKEPGRRYSSVAEVISDLHKAILNPDSDLVPAADGPVAVSYTHLVKVKALNENLEPYELEGDGLLARAICHEIAHLRGELYVDIVEGELMDVGADEEEITEEA